MVNPNKRVFGSQISQNTIHLQQKKNFGSQNSIPQFHKKEISLKCKPCGNIFKFLKDFKSHINPSGICIFQQDQQKGTIDFTPKNEQKIFLRMQ